MKLRQLSLFVIIFALPTLAAFSQRELLDEGFSSIASMQRNVRDIVEMHRAPLFDNAPFLRLREGDKLIKAKEEFVGKKGKRPADPDRVEVYLLSGGKAYMLWTEAEGDKLLLSSAFHTANNCLIFDWDVTLENAKALRELLPNEYAKSLTRKESDAILAALGKDFPDADIRPEAYHPQLNEGEIVSIPGHSFVQFRGVAYNSFHNRLYNYTVWIGPSIFSIMGDILVQGPRRVEKHEFERVEVSGINGNPGQDVDPKRAKIKKAEYEKMVRFQNLVAEAIRSAAE